MAISISSAHVGHYDLATYDPKSEIMMYGTASDDATDYFVRDVRRCILFSQIPVSLTKHTGDADFGSETAWVVNRGGDYMSYSWLRVKTPSVEISKSNEYKGKGRIRWCKNFMHNLVQECQLLFSENRGARFDSFFLDFWSEFCTPSSKKVGYNNMIGNIDLLDTPARSLPSMHLNLPLPLFYSRDTGVALPISAIAYNEVKITIKFRRWQELLILDTTDEMTSAIATRPITENDVTTIPRLSDVAIMANYILLNSQDRTRVGCEPRVMLIEQVQTAPLTSFKPTDSTTPLNTSIRFSFGVKCLFFGVRNKSRPAEWSNYTTHTPVIETYTKTTKPSTTTSSPIGGASGQKTASEMQQDDAKAVTDEDKGMEVDERIGVILNRSPANAVDPISLVSLTYDNSTRMLDVGADYFTLINPFYHAPSISGSQAGMHLYSYALDFYNSDPTGSTNFSKVPSVDLTLTPSDTACTQASTDGKPFQQKYELIVMALVQNIMRIDGGVVGFPIH